MIAITNISNLELCFGRTIHSQFNNSMVQDHLLIEPYAYNSATCRPIGLYEIDHNVSIP